MPEQVPAVQEGAKGEGETIRKKQIIELEEKRHEEPAKRHSVDDSSCGLLVHCVSYRRPLTSRGAHLSRKPGLSCHAIGCFPETGATFLGPKITEQNVGLVMWSATGISAVMIVALSVAFYRVIR